MGNHLKSETKYTPGFEVIFFVVLAAVTIFAWILPLRPTVSVQEKRKLEPFPEFSRTALADGSYYKRIGLWFSDTFPARDRWIGVSQSLEELYGRSDVVIYGVADAGDAIPVPAVSTPAPTPEQDVAVPAAVTETTPVPTEQPEITPAPEEIHAEESPDNTPEEDIWGGKVIEEEEIVTLGAVIQVGDSAFAYTGFVQSEADNYARNISHAAELLDGKCRVYEFFVLHSTTLMLPRAYRESIGCACEEDVLAYVNSQMDPRVGCVDTYTPLVQHNNQYIYFRSDHHWTALGAWYAYAEWAKMAGFEPVGLEEYEENVQEPFYGSLFYQANRNDKIKVDQVYTYTPPGDVHLYVQYNETEDPTWLGEEIMLLPPVGGDDKYLTFLTGDVPMATFVNKSITDGSACLLVKNSNGNPLSYFFTQHYQYVYVLDYRKYFNRNLTQFVDHYDIDDVLFCLSSGQAQSSGGNSLLYQFIQ